MTALQRTPEWHAERRGRVTASNVGALLGLSPWTTREQAIRRIVRHALGAEAEHGDTNPAMEWGNIHEAGARVDYEMDSGNAVVETSFHPLDDWGGASPDGMVGDDGLVEIKCPYGLRKEAHPVPFKPLAEQEHYAAQVQFQMHVTGRAWTDFYQWAPQGQRLERVARDDAWLADAVPRLRQAWAEINHEIAENAAEHLAPLRVVVDTPEARAMSVEYDELGEALERAEERRKELLADMVRLADDKDALFAGRKLTLVSREGSVSYAKLVKDKLPGVDVEPYRGKPSASWRLT